MRTFYTIHSLKPRRAAGFYEIYPDFPTNSDPKYFKVAVWILFKHLDVLPPGSLSPEFKRSKIRAIVEPKNSNWPSLKLSSYIALRLVSVTNFYRNSLLICNRISPSSFNVIPVEWAGFRTIRSCSEFGSSLSTNYTYTEAIFQNYLKTSAVFIDLSTARDTVWQQGLICRLRHVIQCM